MSWSVVGGDNRASLAAMDDASVDAVVTDPPYELGFMGRKWDSTGIAYDVAFWREVYRVLKPGAHLLAFGGTRTYHRMACAIEDAGFEIRDSLHWVYTQGFPKSLDVSKAIDKAEGQYRSEELPHPTNACKGGKWCNCQMLDVTGRYSPTKHPAFSLPATVSSRRWSGWGTALKPSHEPIILARKPLLGTVAENVVEWGTGALNVEGCRIGNNEIKTWGYKADKVDKIYGVSLGMEPAIHFGRWPPNLLLSHTPDCGDTCLPGCAVDEVERQSASSRMFPVFYAAKPTRGERDAGCEALPGRSGAEAVGRDEGSAGTHSPRAGAGRVAATVTNHHPTVKPIDLMRWLVRLITPPGGLVLDPFAGSGTTGCAAVLEGMEFLGLEREAEYVAIAEARIEYWQRQAGVVADDVSSVGGSVQLGLFGGKRDVPEGTEP